MSEMWLAALVDSTKQASARGAAMFGKLTERRGAIAAQLDRTLARIGRAAATRKAEPDPVTRERVLRAMNARSYGAMTIREQRYAATLFTDVTPATMQQFLSECPNNWKAFATDCFRRWGEFDAVADRAAYTRLLCLAPPAIRFVHHGGRPQDLVGPNGPYMLAGSLGASHLLQLRSALQDHGFDSSWTYSAHVMAHWFASRVQQAQAFASAWAAVQSDQVVEAMLLPARSDKSTSWFSNEPRPARVRRSTTAQAMFVAAMIRAAYTGGVDGAQWSAFSENLLRSTFGDPRVPPESKGWSKLRTIDEPAYERFLSQLISEDITVFFEHTMQDPRRKVFWLDYVKSLRRTVCILDLSTKQRLTTQLAGAEKKYAAAIARAQTFARQKCVQAFCLYFDSVVVVEFAESGNAAQVYPREYFEQSFESSIYANQCRDHSVLKKYKPGTQGHMPHVGDWESDVEDKLAQLGIAIPQRAPHRVRKYR